MIYKTLTFIIYYQFQISNKIYGRNKREPHLYMYTIRYPHRFYNYNKSYKKYHYHIFLLFFCIRKSYCINDIHNFVGCTHRTSTLCFFISRYIILFYLIIAIKGFKSSFLYVEYVICVKGKHQFFIFID